MRPWTMLLHCETSLQRYTRRLRSHLLSQRPAQLPRTGATFVPCFLRPLSAGLAVPHHFYLATKSAGWSRSPCCLSECLPLVLVLYGRARPATPSPISSPRSGGSPSSSSACPSPSPSSLPPMVSLTSPRRATSTMPPRCRVSVKRRSWV